MMLHPYYLGASLYMPATRQDIWQVINRQKLANINSIIICLEDAVHKNELAFALENLQLILNEWAIAQQQNQLKPCLHRPLVFLRPRNPQMLAELANWQNISLLDGFVLPKFDLDSLENWQMACKNLSNKQLLMPTLETKAIFNQQHNYDLASVLQESFQQEIFALRIGGNDLLSCLRLRRPHNLTIYQSAIGHLISQILSDFVIHGFYLTAPVFEYWDNEALFQQEVERDVLYGFVGKTVIHPKQITRVQQAFAVDNNEFLQAKAILAEDAQAVFNHDNAMLEPATHKAWAEQILIRKEVFGFT